MIHKNIIFNIIRFSITDAFVGYKGDTAASIILYASQVVSEDLPDDEWEKEVTVYYILTLAVVFHFYR